MDVEFALIQVTKMTVENTCTFWEPDYMDNMFLATYNPAVVVPSKTYEYLKEQFYSFLCEHCVYEDEPETAKMYCCACSGGEYYGMPSLQLITKYRSEIDEPFEKSGFMFDLQADDQELFPTIDKETRGTVCALAIGFLIAENEDQEIMQEAFGLGQIWIRRYNLAWFNEPISWEDDDGTEQDVIETKFYTLKGDPIPTTFELCLGFLIMFSFILIGFIFLSVLRVIRVRTQRKAYYRLKELSNDYDIVVS